MATFDIAAFREAFPAFASDVAYPDASITSQATIGECYIDVESDCSCNPLSWQLIVAHMLFINNQIASGNPPQGQVVSAGVGSVSVSVKPPESKGEFGYWLGLSTYGIQLLALLKKCSSGGTYVGGFSERSAFRRAGGSFPRNGRVW